MITEEEFSEGCNAVGKHHVLLDPSLLLLLLLFSFSGCYYLFVLEKNIMHIPNF